MLLPYDSQALNILAEEIDEWRSLLDYRGPLPRTWAGRLRRDLETEAVAASTSMEGVPVTVEEVRRILAGDRPSETTPADAALVRGYRDAMEFVLRRADDPNFRWNRELLTSLQDRILAGRYSEGAGRLRTTPAFVANSRTGEMVFRPPDPEAVPGLVDEACERMESGHPHPAISSGWIHVATAAIHPFRDGNGRAARVCASLAMYRGGFKLPEFTSLEEWWGHHLAEYYAAFSCLGAMFDRSSDVTPFIKTHLEAQLSQVRALDLRERVQRQIWLAIEEAAVESGLHPRVANSAWDAFFGREVTSRYYRELADVGQVTAATDLKGAVAAGLLNSIGAGRARRYVAGDELYRVVGAKLGLEVRETGEAGRQQIVALLTERTVLAGKGRTRLTAKD